MSSIRQNRSAGRSRTRGDQPGRPRGAADDGRGRDAGRLEEREVRAADPELSPETNAMLTEELREVVGADRVRVPVGRPRATQGELPHRQSITAYLSQHRFQFIRGTSIVLTFAAIIALTTGTWWILPLAAGVHALGTMTVTLTITRMTTIIEHPSPQTAAALAEEGVSSPDERFSQMVEEFSDLPQAGAGEVLSPGSNERTVPAGADPATAAAEQSSAMTPTEDPSEAAGHAAMPDYIVWATALSLLILSIVFPAATTGGWMWLLTAIMVPLIAGWMGMQWLMIVRPDRVRLQGRGPITAVILCTAIAVAGFCAVVAFAFQH